MLDLFGILFSSVMMLIIIVRAVRLDRAQPWFQEIKLVEQPVDKKSGKWRRSF